MAKRKFSIRRKGIVIGQIEEHCRCSIKKGRNEGNERLRAALVRIEGLQLKVSTVRLKNEGGGGAQRPEERLVEERWVGPSR